MRRWQEGEVEDLLMMASLKGEGMSMGIFRFVEQ